MDNGKPTAFATLKKDVEDLRVAVESQSKSYAAAVKKGGTQSRPVKHRVVNRSPSENHGQESQSHVAVDKSSLSTKRKVPVLGARKIWGTMRETSATAVVVTLQRD